jgi:hypothetical protein
MWFSATSILRRVPLPELADELVHAAHQRLVNRLVRVDALDRDADLAGVREAAEDDRARRRLEVAVGAREERCLSAELHHARDQLRAARRRDASPGRHAAGEDELLDAALDERLPGRAEPGDHAEEVLGEARRVVDLFRLLRDERRHLARLEDDRAPGDERRGDVPHRDRERVVPRRDDADDAARYVVDVAAPVLEEVQVDLARREDARRVPAVVGQEIGHGDDLVHQRLVARLAGLGGEDRRDLLRAIDDGVAEAQEAVRALLDREDAPRLLRAARARDDGVDLVLAHHRHFAEEGAARRRVALDRGRAAVLVAILAVPIRVRGECAHGQTV